MESETVEFKKSLSELKEGITSIVAMLNKHGYGELWFGVAPDSTPRGLTITEKTLRDVSQAIGVHIEPRIYPHITEEIIDSKHCILVSFAGQEKPYYAYSRVVMRVADEDRQMSAKEIENLIVSKNQERLRWDNEPANSTLQDLDEERLQSFVKRAKLPWDNAENALEKLGLLKAGKIINPAPLFFTAEPMELRCAVFGTTSSSMIIDRHDFKGDILELIEDAQKYILKNIHIGMKLNGLYREDVPEISMEALREAIINAFCHRDYRDPDYIQVAIFKNRVEIRNPGTLYGGLKLEDLKVGHVSRRRNPTLAELFRRIEMVEAWGRGLPLIVENAPNVEFKETAGLFIAEFARPSYVQNDGGAEETSIENKEAAVEIVQPESRLESRLESQPESRPESDLATRIIRCLLEGECSKSALAERLGHKTVSGELNKQVRLLLEKSFIEQSIPEKPNSRLQKYRLTSIGRKSIESSDEQE
jgi:ATP-dependent DNA helicase RecG